MINTPFITKEHYEYLLNNPKTGYIRLYNNYIYKNVCMFYRISKKSSTLSVYPGSFNPIHKVHRYIYNDIMPEKSTNYYSNQYKCYELSISNMRKNTISLDDLNDRLRQFTVSDTVFITNAPSIQDKINLFMGTLQIVNPIHFYMGLDTFEAIMNSEDIDKINAEFYVGPRHDMTLDDLLDVYYDKKIRPSNVKAFSLPAGFSNISSSNIRKLSNVNV